MNVVVDGLMTNYQKIGKGKVVVLLHGWGDTSQTFSKLIENLEHKYLIYGLDLPGFGGTQTPPSAWGLSNYAEFVAAWLQKVGLERVYAFGGHSYGGAVLIVGLADGLLKADKLFLMASAGVRGKQKLRKNLLKAATKTVKLPLNLLPAQRRRRLRSKFYSTIGSDLTLLPHMELTFKRIIGEDVRLKAKSIKIPTLLIYGSSDKETPINDGQILSQAINNSRLEIVQGAGHFLHQEQVEQVAGLVSNFLKESK